MAKISTSVQEDMSDLVVKNEALSSANSILHEHAAQMQEISKAAETDCLVEVCCHMLGLCECFLPDTELIG